MTGGPIKHRAIKEGGIQDQIYLIHGNNVMLSHDLAGNI